MHVIGRFMKPTAKNNRYKTAMVACLTLLFTLSCFLPINLRGPLKFNPEKLPEAQAGIPYEVKITITQNATPAGQFSVSEGNLPKGLALETLQGENTARISGIPEEAGTFIFRIHVWCYGTNVSGQTGEMSYTIIVK
jgi:hypothetical protein